MSATRVHPASTVASAPRFVVPAGSAHRSPRRVAVAASLSGLFGAGVLAYGVVAPWLTTEGGLVSQSGWGTRNGSILLAAAVLSALLSACLLVVAGAVMRWLLALTGFGAAAFAGYLLIQLATVTQPSEGGVPLVRGPGLYLATAGAGIVFATVFLPMPVIDAARATALPASRGSAERAAPWLLRAIGSPLRGVTAALAVIAGVAHVPVTPEHLNEAPYIGVLFIILTVVCVLLAAVLLISDSPLAWATLGASCLLAVVAYVVSRTIGLPLMADDIGNWLEGLGVVSVLTETAVAVLAFLALVSAPHRRRNHD